MQFEWTFGSQMEACWHQDRIKNRCQLRKGDFQKTNEKTQSFLNDFLSFGVELGIKNQSKIDQKLKPKMNCLLASIFGGFWWVLGSKLGGKSNQERTKND